MNRPICEREDQTAAAIRSGLIGGGTIDGGTIGDEIATHARGCPICAEILLVGEFLHANADLADHERTLLPDPAILWQKTRRQATQQAVRRALRPIRFMKIIACVAFACAPWLRWLLPMARELAAPWSQAFDLNLAFLSKPWPATASQSTLLVGLSGTTILLLALSSWYMLRQE